MSDQTAYFRQLQEKHEFVKQQQHVQFFRKVLLRKRLLRWVRKTEGVAYVPFIGDGDIAAELYGDRAVYGADIAPYRVEKARERVQGYVLIADCDSWPFPGLEEPVAIADFDAYVEPYKSFRSAWPNMVRADRMVLFFTDGRREGMTRTNSWRKPDGTRVDLTRSEKMPIYNAYLSKHIWPWIDEFIGDEFRVLERFRYQRARMVYWGQAIERTS